MDLHRPLSGGKATTLSGISQASQLVLIWLLLRVRAVSVCLLPPLPSPGHSGSPSQWPSHFPPRDWQGRPRALSHSCLPDTVKGRLFPDPQSHKDPGVPVYPGSLLSLVFTCWWQILAQHLKIASFCLFATKDNFPLCKCPTVYLCIFSIFSILLRCDWQIHLYIFEVYNVIFDISILREMNITIRLVNTSKISHSYHSFCVW